MPDASVVSLEQVLAVGSQCELNTWGDVPLRVHTTQIVVLVLVMWYGVVCYEMVLVMWYVNCIGISIVEELNYNGIAD